MYKYYNVNPRGIHTNDCVKRAIAVATGMDYKKVQLELNRYKKVTGAKRFSSDRNPHRYVEEVLHGKKIELADGTNAEDFCLSYPKGRYILDMKEHWSCIVDGVIYDSWNCSRQMVYYAYEVQAIGKNMRIDLSCQVFKSCCTAEQISPTTTRIRFYDHEGKYTEEKIPTTYVDGYLLCLERYGFVCVKL